MGADPNSPSSISAADLTTRSPPLIERAPLPSVEVHGPKHLVSHVNPAFCQLLGKTKTELVGQPFAEIVPRGDECVPILDRVYGTGEAITHSQEIDFQSHAAQWLYAMWPTLDGAEQPVGVIIQLTRAADFRQDTVAINEALLISSLRQHELTDTAVKLNAQLEREIIERRLTEAALQTANDRLANQAVELERLVVERTQKLHETIEELEAFSYSVAHDMRAPLRGMQGYAQILLEEHTVRLNAEARGYLESIASSATRMDMLIQDVLNYTRVLSGEALVVTVNLDRLVREIIGIYPNWRSPKVEIKIEGLLPLVLGHEGFLTQCVSNLLSNAVKFVAPGITPRVRIWSEDRPLSPTQEPWSAEKGEAPKGWEKDGPVVRVWFENNGIGIAPNDRGRVFRMFDRINPAEKFEGTGIGLTIVRKAVQRMGGRTDFESEPGQGSKFWIELKKAPPQASPNQERHRTEDDSL